MRPRVAIGVRPPASATHLATRLSVVPTPGRGSELGYIALEQALEGGRVPDGMIEAPASAAMSVGQFMDKRRSRSATTA